MMVDLAFGLNYSFNFIKKTKIDNAKNISLAPKQEGKIVSNNRPFNSQTNGQSEDLNRQNIFKDYDTELIRAVT
jgi:hypothetical protein